MVDTCCDDLLSTGGAADFPSSGGFSPIIIECLEAEFHAVFLGQGRSRRHW